MTLEARLADVFSHWHRLAQAQNEAILARDWYRLLSCHETIKELQLEIGAAVEQRGQSLSLICVQSLSASLRDLVRQVMALEQRNAGALAELHQEAAVELAGLQTATRNLRRVRSSYAPAGASRWNSLS